MHAIGIPAALIATAWLLIVTVPVAAPRVTASLVVYGIGLVGMLAASAAFHLTRPGPVRRTLRRLDHAMIYVMIAGSYTPFALDALGAFRGVALCTAEWLLAALGVVLRFACSGRAGERAAFALYLGMGWLLVLVIRPLVAALPGELFAFLLAGGLVYTLGTVVHVRSDRIPFGVAVWHAMVLLAAALQFVAVAGVLGRVTA